MQKFIIMGHNGLSRRLVFWMLVAVCSVIHCRGMSYPCGFPGRPKNGTSTTASAISRPGDTVQYSCRPGFTLSGETERVCLESGIWAGEQPLCEWNLVLNRPTLMSDQLWLYAPELAVDGNTDTCSFTPRTSDQKWWQVDLTYDEHIGSVALSMRKDNYYELTIFVSKLISNTEALYRRCARYKGRFPKEKMHFICNKGKGNEGRYVYIRDDRKRSNYFGLCEVEVFAFRDNTSCGEPEKSVGSVVTINENTATYSCLPGYQLVDPPNRTCEEGGHWTGHSPQCREISCGQPPRIENTVVNLINRTTTLNSMAAYSCRAGYYLPQGTNQSIVCLESGEWESVNLTCLQDDESKHQMAVKSRDEFLEDTEEDEGGFTSLHLIISAGIIASLLLVGTVAATFICRYRSRRRYNTAQSSSNDLLSAQSKKTKVDDPETPRSEQPEVTSFDSEMGTSQGPGQAMLGMDILARNMRPSASSNILNLPRQLPRSHRMPEEEFCKINEELDCIRYSLGSDFQEYWGNDFIDRQNRAANASDVPFTHFEIVSEI